MAEFQYLIHNGTTLELSVRYDDIELERATRKRIAPGGSIALSTVKMDSEVLISQDAITTEDGIAVHMGVITIAAGTGLTSIVRGPESTALEMKVVNKSAPGDGEERRNE